MHNYTYFLKTEISTILISFKIFYLNYSYGKLKKHCILLANYIFIELSIEFSYENDI